MKQQHWVVLLDTTGKTIKTMNVEPITNFNYACALCDRLNNQMTQFNKFGGFEVVTENVEENAQ